MRRTFTFGFVLLGMLAVAVLLLRAPLKPCATGEETQFPLKIKQAVPSGKMLLEKIWLRNNMPIMLVISGRWIGAEPRERYDIRLKLREEPKGAESSDQSWYVPLPASPKSGNPAEIPFLFECRNFPLSCKTIYGRIYFTEKSTGKVTAINEFEMPNPFRSQSQGWKTKAPPATAKSDPLEIQLLTLSTGLLLPQENPGLRRSVSKLNLRVLENGALTRSWSPMDIRLVASSGAMAQPCGARNAYGNVETTLDGTLWKSDGPWKVIVTLMRTRDFHPDEVIELRDLTFPATGELLKRNQHWSVAGNEVQFLGIAGENTKAPEWNLREPESVVTLHFKNKNCWLRLLSISDENGKVLYVPKDYCRRDYQWQRSCFDLPPMPERPQKLTCKFGVVWEQRVVEMTATPTFSGASYSPKPESGTTSETGGLIR